MLGKSYKKEFTEQLHEQQKGLYSKSKNLRSKNPKEYWRKLNGHTNQDKGEIAGIMTELYVRHFKKISNN